MPFRDGRNLNSGWWNADPAGSLKEKPLGETGMKRREQSKAMLRLEELEARLAKDLKQRTGFVIEPAADPVDQLLNLVDREYYISTLARAAEQYRAVRRAIKRVEKGTYGLCLECDEPIAPRRLEALPWASLCIRCQELAERQVASGELEQAA